jgi:hypothetical protein
MTLILALEFLDDQKALKEGNIMSDEGVASRKSILITPSKLQATRSRDKILDLEEVFRSI